MAFDAYFLTAVLDEMREKLAGARVEKIHQPSRDTILLHLRCDGSREKLLIAANPAAPRMHLTASSPENPDQPPMFCMLLRKHLTGARLKEITQLPMERMARFTFSCVDEMGDQVEKSLVVELMGRTCNVYLLDPTGRILDCLRRIGLDESSRRAALPGLHYQLPEPIEKEDPATFESYVNLLEAPGADLLADRLMDSLGGLSPLICREAALFAAGDTDARLEGLDLAATADRLQLFFQEHLRHPAPYYYTAPDGTPKQFAFCPIRQYERLRPGGVLWPAAGYLLYCKGPAGCHAAKEPERPKDRFQSVPAVKAEAGRSGKGAAGHIRPGAAAPAGRYRYRQSASHHQGPDPSAGRGFL